MSWRSTSRDFVAAAHVAALSAVALLPRRRPRRSAIMGLTSKSALYSEGPSCQVHPQVLFSIVDHFSRREGGQNRVIGTLLGTVGADGVVEVDSCFPVPHTETEEQVAVNDSSSKSALAAPSVGSTCTR